MRFEEAAGDKDKQMMKIAIIGSGLIGRAWAVVFCACRPSGSDAGYG